MKDDRFEPRAWRPGWAAPTGCLAIIAGCAAFAVFAAVGIAMFGEGLAWLAGTHFALAGLIGVAGIAVAHVSAIALWFRAGRIRMMIGLVGVALLAGLAGATVAGGGSDAALVVCVLTAAHGVGFGGARLVGLGERLGSPVHWRRRRLAAGRCPRCGYDIRGTRSVRCPECGDRLDFPAVFPPAPPDPDASSPPTSVPPVGPPVTEGRPGG